ncbi:hypothetical protein TTHERM_00043850 (macronuclear) [Tetrahymena thermophila SB210]|uniref:Uncharacterized protein n=1 Tax=Tetrahymena thermophila (strain SB210) TaxID=312017 RepID=Q23DV8_TETTS|nr:hypothetical protein TTHERM_00043850 [Tetrahymena thermophila SB210]EAR94473.3 hypothetical protein TTHERM_00043850 [Tetrahymena thermophila SB210]|eukprot:XP_001014578.3 hypothetical protein TTHERM_00043850 [Tetrahymena thermophila SB210]
MIYQHKNSIPELKDLSEQRYLMRLQQKQKDPLQQQFQQQQQGTYLLNVQDPYLNQINDNSNPIQIQQMYIGKSEQKQFVNQDIMEEFPLDKNQQSPFAHRTNQQRSKTISLMNYKEIRNNSQENNQKGMNTTSNQQGNKAFIQQQEGNRREQLQYQPTSTLANNQMNLQSPTDNSYKKYDQNINTAYYPLNQMQLLNQQQFSNQQQINNCNNLNLDYVPQSNQAQYLNQLQTPQSSLPQYQINRTNNHQLNFIDNQNNGVRSNSQQGYLDPSTAPVRGNSQQHNIDLNGTRSNSQQGFHNYSVGTPLGMKQNYNHFLSQNQILTNQTQGLTNMTTTNNNNSLESLIDLENKWSDIKRVHQNFQQRSLSNSSSSNSIAPNHRPNSSLNVSTNNNLSFINASSALVDQVVNNSKNFQNSSMPQTPFESKLEKQNSIQSNTNNNNSNNNNNKLIKKVVPLSKINLNSIIQTTGSNSFMNSNQFSTANSSKNTKVKLNLHGSFQEQIIDKNNPFESQSLPGSTRGHHDSFQGLNYNQTHSTYNNNQSQSQLYEFDSRPTQNMNYNQNKIQDNSQNSNLSMFNLHQNNQYIDSGFLSHQVSQAHASSTNELYNSSIPKQQLNNANLYQQNIYQISSGQQQHQLMNPTTTHQKCLSYQDLKPQQCFKNNSISIQENYQSNSLLDNNLSNYLEFNVNNHHSSNNNNYSLNNTMNITNKTLYSNTNLQQKINGNYKYQQNFSQSPNKTNGIYLNPNQPTNINFDNTQSANNPNYVSFEQKQGDDQFNKFNNQINQFQHSNHQTANFKQPNSYTQDLNNGLTVIYQNKGNQKPFTTSSTKENNECKSKNQDILLQSPQINNQQRLNYRASPNSLQAQQAHNAQSKERKSPNSKNASDIKPRKKSQEEIINVQEQNKKKTYSEQQFEFMKQLLPTYSQHITKKNLFSQALAQQKGSFDLNSVLPNQNAQNQLDFTPIQEHASQNEIDNHLQAKYNEYKQRIQYQQRDNNGNNQGLENAYKTANSNIYANSYLQAAINHTQNQASLSSKKRPSTFQNSNQGQSQKEVQLKDHYQTAYISEIIKDQRNITNECNEKVSLSQKLIDQENRNPNNAQVRQLDHESLLKLKQGLKHSNSQGQNEFIQMQIQLQQQYQSVNNGSACNNQQSNNSQITQQKTYSPRVNYKIISENIKKQKFGVVQKNEKIIQNNQAEQTKKSYVQNPSQNISNQSQSFFPEQLLVPVSKSFIETKKVQANSNAEKSVNEMYENKNLNSNNLNVINKKNSKLTEIPIKQVVSKKILPKYQSVATDISEDMINNNNSGNIAKTIQQNIKAYQKTQTDEPKKKKLSITQAELNIPQNQNSQKIQQQVPSSTKYNSQQIGFQKTEVEKTTLKRQHSSSTSNAIYDPFKIVSQDQQAVKGLQPVNQQNNSTYECNLKILDNFGNENTNALAQNNQNRQSYLLNKNNPSANYNKIQCMPCNKNLVEAKLQKKEEQIKITKGKVEQKLEVNREILQNQLPIKSISGAHNKLSQQPQQQSQQPKTYSSFIIPNLVFN